MKRGKFIVLDGPDGAGKTTQAKLLAKKLKAHGISLITPREPGGTKTGEAVRRILLDRRKTGMTALTEMLLFQAARAQLLAEVIRPALKKGTWVLCDRFALSTLVYQGYAGGVSLKEIRSLTRFICGDAAPDLYLLLDVPMKETLKRRKAEGRKADRMESKGNKFALAVRNSFIKEGRHREKGRKIKQLSGIGTIDVIQDEIWKAVKPLLPKTVKRKN